MRLALSAGNSPLKLLFNGEPGVGRSALAAYTQQLLQCDKWSTTRLNGTQVKIEKVEELVAQLQGTSLFSTYRLVWIDEADKIPPIAQVRFLTMMDEMPNASAMICTSNCKVSEFEARFQTRFQVFELEGPQPHEIESLLRRYVPDDPNIRSIASFALGNVRQALLDTQGLVQAAA